MHITRMTIGGIPPFTEPVEFEFDARVNLFIGPNATGKSTLVRALKSERSTHRGRRGEGNAPRPYFSADVNFAPSRGGSHVTSMIDSIRRQHPFVFVPATRLSLPFNPDDENMRELLAKRNITHDLGVCLTDSLYAFDSSNVYCAVKIVNEQLPTQTMSHAKVREHFRVKEIPLNCAHAVCEDVLSGENLSDFVDSVNILATGTPPIRAAGSTTRSVGSTTVVHHDMGASVKRGNANSDDNRLFVGSLSAGTQGTLLWIWYLALRIAHFYDFNTGWQNQPAVLLIDEIENHLHPTWQRRVIPALLKYFPGLQIFATTHSPFVVAGLKAGQVHMLKRDNDGVIAASTNTEDIVGWTMDEVLRALMGVDDPTDEATAAAARELRELRNAGPAGDATGEEQRQARMQELRQLVDRDLLAGGPMAAQQERFERDFAEALEKYRQSRDLKQEGG